MDIWSGRAAQNYGMLQLFGCPTYFSIKDDNLNPRVKKFVLLGVKRNLKGHVMRLQKKKIALSRYITFAETSLLKSTLSVSGEDEDQRFIAVGEN